MDAATLRLIQALDAYLEYPRGRGIPNQLKDNVEDLRTMLNAPKYTEESPGEREAREVAAQAMPDDLLDSYYPGNGYDETSSSGF